METPMNILEAKERRRIDIELMSETLIQEFNEIDESLLKLNDEFTDLFNMEYNYIRFHDCGRNCRGCPHPTLSRLSRRDETVVKHLYTPEYEALRTKFYRLKRRRGKLLSLTQRMHMSIYRLGGASHRSDSEALDV